MIRVLIADDEQASASIIQYFFESYGLPAEIVGVAYDGLQAVQYINELKPDLVFLDIKMPFLNGFEVMDAVGQGTFIIVTAYDSFKNAQKALRHGAKDILHKPIDGEQLMQTIMRTMGCQFTKNAIVNEIIGYLHTHYNSKVTLDELSEKFHATPSHMARTFKKHTGKSILNYLHEVRISAAKKLLTDTEKSIKEVAPLVGYENLNNFYKYFKSLTNFTPAVFRQKNVHTT